MKPEMILQSDLLDIVFLNRNKAYGAYVLRKGYHQRMVKAMTFTFGLLLLLCTWKLMQGNEYEQAPAKVIIPVKDVHISNVDPYKPPVEKVLPSAAPKMKQVANPTYTIVPDDKADKPINTQDDLELGKIGTVNVDGAPVDGPPELPSNNKGTGLANVPAEAIEAPALNIPLEKAEEMPEFPGGKEAFQQFMMRHLRHPENLEEGEKVVVRIKFVVDTDGYIRSPEVLQTDRNLHKEVLRVINKMPRWKPGKQNGRLVPVYFQLPVTFTSQFQ